MNKALQQWLFGIGQRKRGITPRLAIHKVHVYLHVGSMCAVRIWRHGTANSLPKMIGVSGVSSAAENSYYFNICHR
jgi:hypothetical protein